MSRRWKGTTTFQDRPIEADCKIAHGVKNQEAMKHESSHGPQDRRKWADYPTSEEDEAGDPASSSPVDSTCDRDTLRPLESRMRSAEQYYAPRDVVEEEEEPEARQTASGSDGLDHHGDPGEE